MKTSNKKTLIFFLAPLLTLLVVLSLCWFMFNLYKQPDNKKIILTPEKVLNINEPFSGKIYFNDELNHNDFSRLIINSIDEATSNVQLAMYSIDSRDIVTALYQAADRGVKVNLILSTKHEAAEKNLFNKNNSNLTIKFVGGTEDQYMHHKFLIVDLGRETQKIFFSSYNFTNLQERYDPSFIFESGRPEIISIFEDEFNRLSNDATLLAKRSGKYNPYAALINYSDGYLEIWFTPSSPEKNIKERMLNLINSAKDNVKALIWFLTDKDVSFALLSKAQEIPVRIITDDFNFDAQGSTFPILAAQTNKQKISNLEILTDSKRNVEVAKFSKDDSLNSFLHQHSLIIDDKTVLFGTNNWSSGGFFGNDESIMVSNIPSIVVAFRTSFLHNYNVNK